MGTKTAKSDDSCIQGVFLVIESNRWRGPAASIRFIFLPLILKKPAKGILPHISDNKHGIASIMDLMSEMMENPPTFAHSRPRKNNMWTGIPVERHGFLYRLHKLEFLKLKRIHPSFEKSLMGILVKGLGMLSKYVGNLCGQRAVHIYRHTLYVTRNIELMEKIEKFLGTAIGETWNNYRTAPVKRFIENLFQQRLHINNRIMHPVTIGGFHNHKINIPMFFSKNKCRILNYRLVETTDITTIQNSFRFTATTVLNHRHCRSKDMTRIIKGTGEIMTDCYRMFIRYSTKILERLVSHLHGIKRVNNFELMFFQQLLNCLGLEPVRTGLQQGFDIPQFIF